MRSIFFWLLLANVGFFAWMQYAPPVGEREPGRMKTQVNQEKIKILLPEGGFAPLAQAQPPRPAVAETPAPAAQPPAPPQTQPAQPQPPVKAAVAEAPRAKPESICRAFVGITANLARALQAEIIQTYPALKATLPQIKDAEDYWVYIPPRPTKAAAEKKLEELAQIGIDDAFLIQEAGPHQFAISLGLFRNEDLALQHLAKLGKQGVRSAVMMARERNRGDSLEKLTLNISGNATAVTRLEKEHTTLAGISAVDCAAR